MKTGLLTLLLTTIYFVSASAWWRSRGWNKLSVTFGKFSALPESASISQKDEWKKIDSCNANTYFRGNRYVQGNDKSVMLLFDSSGKIGGIQFGIKKDRIVGPPEFFNRTHWNSDGDFFVITAYFDHPSVICSGTRPHYKDIGRALYIQVGPSPNDLMQVPMLEEGISGTKWVTGKCFPGMGQHYWYNISNDMDCLDFFPVFLLYNGGKLNAFGWALPGDVQSSRVEHPTPTVFPFFFRSETRPSCLSEDGPLTTQHIYLEARPYLNWC